MRACLFGTYNRGHSANRIVANVLRAAGFELLELHEPLWERTRDKDASYFSPAGLLRLVPAWCRAAISLTRKWYRSGGAPLVVVGFNGQLDLLLLRLISRREGLQVVFAPLVSITETLVDDRGVYAQGSIAARLLAGLDRFACRMADTVVVDTQAHAEYFVERLGVARSKLHVAHLGVDTEAFPVATSRAQETARSRVDEPLEVLYFGQYLPLHGLNVIAEAAELLAERDNIRFVFIGTGESRAAIQARLRTSGAEFIDWVAYEELGERVGLAGIALGVFGESVKAKMVIPNKVYEAAAAGCAIITADTPAVREVFRPGEDLEVCEADGRSLARAIERLAAEPERRAELGRNASRVMATRFTDDALANSWQLAFGTPPVAPAVCEKVRALEAERTESNPPRIAVTVLNYGDAEATLTCIDSLRAGVDDDTEILIVDNASSEEDRSTLEQGLVERPGIRVLQLAINTGYAGGNNRAMQSLFGDGADYVLLLNDDTVVAPGAITEMVNVARSFPDAGLVGPRILRDTLDGSVASVGERIVAPLAWVPRTLTRYRAPRQQPYRVSGLLGCALLVRRDAFEKLGGLDESYFAYYEEVDYCLRAPTASLACYVAPLARVAHRGQRGFAGGMTETAAYLKSRNLSLFGERRTDGLGRLVFLVGSVLLLLASALGYVIRGRSGIVATMFAGARAGIAGETGAPPIALERGDTPK